MHTKYIIDISTIKVYDVLVMNKTKRTPEQLQTTKSHADRILNSGRLMHMAVGKLSLDGIISKEGVIYDDLIEDAPTPDMQATRKSEAAWKAHMPEANADGPQLRIVGETAVGAHIEVQSISTEQTIPVHVQHSSAA